MAAAEADPAPDQLTTAPDGRQLRTAPFRRVAGPVIVLVVVVLELVLGVAYVNLTAAAHETLAANDATGAFRDVQRLYTRLALDISAAERLDDEPVPTTLALVDRQIEIARTRLAEASTDAELRENSRVVVEQHDRVRTFLLTNPDDPAAALEQVELLLPRIEEAVTRTETRLRDALLRDAAAASRTATAVAVVAAILLVGGAALVWGVLRHYERAFDDAWSFALAREDDLLGANEELSRLVASREQLMSVLSHELRSPLGVIGAVAETLSTHGDRLDDETRNRMLDSLRRQVARQQRLIDDLLTVAKQTGELHAEPEVVDVAAVAALLLQDAADRELELVGPAPCTALVDPDQLEQVLDNLVRNAEKYGDGTIRVHWLPDGDTVRVTVEDGGDGVPPAFRDQLFEPFTQAERAGGTESGVGLGLSIAHRLIEANNGTIHYEDRPGGGARFVLTIPRAA